MFPRVCPNEDNRRSQLRGFRGPVLLRGISHASDDDAFDETLLKTLQKRLQRVWFRVRNTKTMVTPPSARTWVKTLRNDGSRLEFPTFQNIFVLRCMVATTMAAD
jgi:hypothetical protein